MYENWYQQIFNETSAMRILHASQIDSYNLYQGVILLPANSNFAVLSAKQNELKTFLIYTCIKKKVRIESR